MSDLDLQNKHWLKMSWQKCSEKIFQKIVHKIDLGTFEDILYFFWFGGGGKGGGVRAGGWRVGFVFEK